MVVLDNSLPQWDQQESKNGDLSGLVKAHPVPNIIYEIANQKKKLLEIMKKHPTTSNPKNNREIVLFSPYEAIMGTNFMAH